MKQDEVTQLRTNLGLLYGLGFSNDEMGLLLQIDRANVAYHLRQMKRDNLIEESPIEERREYIEFYDADYLIPLEQDILDLLYNNPTLRWSDVAKRLNLTEVDVKALFCWGIWKYLENLRGPKVEEFEKREPEEELIEYWDEEEDDLNERQ